MIHGVYLRNKPKALWHLISVSVSAEVATKDRDAALKAAIQGGNDEAQAAIQTFDSIWFLPESVKEIKETSKLLYN